MRLLSLAAASALALFVGPARAEPLESWRPLSAIAPAPASDDAEQQKKEDARKRASLRTLHRAFGITTWISLAATNTLGTMRYANVIGFGDPLCDPGGSPVLGRSWGCGDGLKYQHLVSASFTTLSYATTRTIAALMPDPYNAADSNPNLKWHRRLSWVHLVGMIAMPVLGFATAATDDEGTRKTLATAHLITGYTTFAAVSTAAVLMVF